MGKPEKEIINNFLSNLKDNQRFFRINAGMGWVGQYTKNNNMLIIKNPRPLYAAPEGWPDITGWETVTITPDMVGQKIAVFSVVEVKTGSLKLSEKQNRFKELILKMGGRFEELRPS